MRGRRPGAESAPRRARPKPTADPVECDGDDATCKETSTAGVSSEGVGVGVRSERVVRLKKPGSAAFTMGIDGGFMYGTSTNASSLAIYGGGANLNLMVRAGGKFPGEAGGSWSGIGVDVYGGVFGAGVVAGNTGAGMLLVTFGGAFGYQFFHFGRMREADFKQHGFGLFLGGRAGVASSNVWFQGGESSSSDAQYGPQITLSFPSYNFGTASRSSFYISGFVLPTGDFLFVNVQLGGSFSL